MAQNGFSEISRSIGYTVREIMTPENDLTCWDGHEETRKQALTAAGDDITFLPVRPNGVITGIIRREELESGQAHTPLTSEWLIAADTPILELLRLFAEKPDRVFLVLQSSQIVGLVAPADLNQIAARASVYLLSSHFEAELATLIRALLPEEEQYVGYVTSKSNLGIARKNQKKSRKEDIELDLLHYLNLSDLVDIVVQNSRLRELLDFTSEEAARKELDTRVVRNPVSHSANLLIADRKKLDDVNDACERLITISAKIRHAKEQVKTQ